MFLSTFYVIYAATIVWVAFDSKTRCITIGRKPYSLTNGALVWVLAHTFLWYLVYPIYIWIRTRRLKRQEPNGDYGRTAMLLLIPYLIGLGLLIAYWITRA